MEIGELFTWYKSKGSNNHATRWDLEQSMPRSAWAPVVSDLLEDDVLI